MSTSELSHSALARLERHAKRRGVEIGEMMHLALNALETAEAQPGAHAVNPENHSGASVAYDGGAGSAAGARARNRREDPGGAGRTGPGEGASGTHRERRRFHVRRQGGAAEERVIDPENPGRVAHSRIREAKVDGRPIDSPSWNGLVAELVIRALDASIDPRELKRLSKSVVVRGWTDEEGFTHYPKGDVSIQRRGAEVACRAVVALARRVGAQVDVEVEWLPKPEAQRPGERGRMRVGASLSRRG